MDTLIKNGLVVRPDGSQPADIRISGEKIVEVGPDLAGDGCNIEDAAGCLVFPGFIDSRVYFETFDGATTTADDFASGTAAAAAGGVTTVLELAVQRKGRPAAQSVDEQLECARGNCACDYGIVAGITEFETAKNQLERLFSSGVTSFMAYMAGERLAMPDEDIALLMGAAESLGGLTQVRCEDGKRIEQLAAQQTRPDAKLLSHYADSRPAVCEADAVRRLGELAVKTGAAACVSPVSCKSALDELRRARKDGARLYAETSLPYLVLDSSVYGAIGFAGSKYVCQPPLRLKSDVMALWHSARHRELDFISSAHCGFNFGTQKIYGINDFTRIPCGMPGVQYLAALIYNYGMLDGLITENQLVKLLCETPARLFGMYPQKGCLQPGADADVVIWERYTKGVITARDHMSKTDYTPYENTHIQGKPRAVYLRGELVSKDGALCDTTRGKFVKRGRSQLTRE